MPAFYAIARRDRNCVTRSATARAGRAGTGGRGAEIVPVLTGPSSAASDGRVGEGAAAPRVLGHVPGLDGIRGLAILLVVGLHIGFILKHDGSSYLPGGFLGVDIFFVLSGFLITALLLDEHGQRGRVSFPRFYLRRACRLLPALFVLLAANFLYAVVSHKPLRAEVKAIGAIVLYVSDITQSAHKFMPQELAHTWSLSVEEQFYFVWPTVFVLALAWQLRRRPHWWNTVVPTLVPIGIAATIVARIMVWRTLGYPAAYMLPFCRSDELLVGCGLAFLWHAGRLHRRFSGLLAWASLAGLGVVALAWKQNNQAMYYGGFTLVALGTAAVIHAVLMADQSLTAAFTWRPLRAVGRVSYGLYLWHVMIFDIVARHYRTMNPWGKVVIGLLLTAVATLGSWFLIEQPFLRLKRRYTRAGERADEANAAAAPAVATS